MLDFAEFVAKEYRNDPILMVDAFNAEIAIKAAEAFICWEKTRPNVPIRHHQKVSTDTFVKVLDSNYKGRVFVNVGIYEYQFKRHIHKSSFKGGGKTTEVISVPFPYFYFGNFASSASDSKWSGIECLWAEYNRYKSGQAPKKSQKSHSQLAKVQEASEQALDEKRELQQVASEKDITWMKKLTRADSPGDYFSYKGASTLSDQIKLLTGFTTKGVEGEFRGVPVIDGQTRKIKGMQRYYASKTGKKAQKVFRKHFNPMGCLVPFGLFSDGEIIYIAEQVASASIINRLTDMSAVSYLFVDNIYGVVEVLKNRYPNSPIINVRDDDATKSVNAGAKAQRELESRYSGLIVDHPPPFDREELLAGNSDLSDFWLLQGDDKTRKFLLNINR